MRRPLLLLSVAISLAGCSLFPGPISVSVTQRDITDLAREAQGFRLLQVDVSNSRSGTVRNVVIHDSLPPGYSYNATVAITGDAIRTRTDDPSIGTPSPSWGAFSLPGGTDRKPAVIHLQFTIKTGRDPSRTPNNVVVSSDAVDDVTATRLVITPKPQAVVDLTVAARTPVQAGQLATYTIRVRNTGTTAAHHVFISATLPTYFVYSATSGLQGNGLREFVTDPFPNSLMPSWGTWTVPPSALDGSPGLLQLNFQAKVLADAAPGNYPISVTITYDDLPAQTISDQAPVQVIRG
ncbi:MAG: COG1361 family protein [Candidatus Dormibacteria bacterium]